MTVAESPETGTAESPNTALLQRMLDLGAHLMPLGSTIKKPVRQGWPSAAAMTLPEAETHLSRGGNLGVNLAPSRLICLDAENHEATAAVTAAGFTPTVIPAKAQDPDSPKYGGSHTWLRVPDHIDPATLPSDRIGITLPNGGKLDVLAGVRYAVAPPSALAEAPGLFYAPANSGPLDPSEAEFAELLDADETPGWLFDADAPMPPGTDLSPLLGILAPPTARERMTATAASQELTDIIDAHPWSEWLAGCSQLVSADEIDTCGCGVYHWIGADNDKSVTLHDGCKNGCGAHVWSATMINALGLSDDHLSRMQLAAAVHGISEKEAAARVGISLGGGHEELAALTPDYFEYEAELLDRQASAGANVKRMEAEVSGPGTAQLIEVVVGPDGLLQRAGQARQAAAVMRLQAAMLPPAPDADDPDLRPTVVGGGSPRPQLWPPAPTAVVEGEIIDDAEPVDDDEKWLADGEGAARRLDEIAAELAAMRHEVPALGRIADFAESRGVYFVGLIAAILPRVSARIPANVLIAPRNGLCTDPVEGTGLGYFSMLLGPPATGKTTTQTAAAAAVPLLDGINEIPTGTAEGIAKQARKTARGGSEIIVSTSVFVSTDEVGSVLSELKRDTSKYAAFCSSAWFGNTTIGQTTSRDELHCVLPPHSTRIAQSIGAQPTKLGPLLADAGSGASARYDYGWVGSVAPAERGPLYGQPVAPIIRNLLPFDPTPGTPFGHRVLTAAEKAAEAGDGEYVGPDFVAVRPETLEPFWVRYPTGVLDGSGAADKAAARSRNWRAAARADRAAGRTDGHDHVMIMKTATLLCALDASHISQFRGEVPPHWMQPTHAHWKAAELLAEARRVTLAEAKVLADDEDAEERRVGGALRGIELAHGQASARAEVTSSVETAAAKQLEILRRLGGTARRGQLGGNAIAVRLRPYRDEAITLLHREGLVNAVGDTVTLRQAPAALAPPATA